MSISERRWRCWW